MSPYPEKILESFVRQLNATVCIQQEQTFRHTVKQRFLPVLRLSCLLLLGLLELLDITPGGHLQGAELRPPPQVDEQQCDQRNDG
jgi:hypothetical protein